MKTAKKTAKKKQYGWKRGARTRGLKAQVVGEHLDALENQHGYLTAKIVLTDAEDPESPLHGWFEWDDSAAAIEHRLAQARELLRSYTLVWIDKRGRKRETRELIPIPYDDKPCEFQYKSSECLRNPSDRNKAIAYVLRQLVAIRNRHAELVELGAIFSAIDQTAVALRSNGQRQPKKKGVTKKHSRQTTRSKAQPYPVEPNPAELAEQSGAQQSIAKPSQAKLAQQSQAEHSAAQQSWRSRAKRSRAEQSLA